MVILVPVLPDVLARKTGFYRQEIFRSGLVVWIAGCAYHYYFINENNLQYKSSCQI